MTVSCFTWNHIVKVTAIAEQYNNPAQRWKQYDIPLKTHLHLDVAEVSVNSETSFVLLRLAARIGKIQGPTHCIRTNSVTPEDYIQVLKKNIARSNAATTIKFEERHSFYLQCLESQETSVAILNVAFGHKKKGCFNNW